MWSEVAVVDGVKLLSVHSAYKVFNHTSTEMECFGHIIPRGNAVDIMYLSADGTQLTPHTCLDLSRGLVVGAVGVHCRLVVLPASRKQESPVHSGTCAEHIFG